MCKANIPKYKKKPKIEKQTRDTKFELQKQKAKSRKQKAESKKQKEKRKKEKEKASDGENAELRAQEL
jgi:hypothetical protein